MMLSQGGRDTLAKLAERVIKRRKLILAIWLLAFLLMVPLAPLVFQSVDYEVSDTSRENLESVQGNDLIDRYFGDFSEQGSTLVVVCGEDVFSGELRGKVLLFQDAMVSVEREEGALQGLSKSSHLASTVQIDSLYTLLYHYTLGYVKGLREGYEELNQTVALMAYAIYGVPDSFLEVRDGIKMAMPTADLVTVNMMAYEQVVRGIIDHPELEMASKQLILTYFGAFYQQYNGSTVELTVPQVESVIESTVISLSSDLGETGDVLLLVQQALNLDDWSAAAPLMALSETILGQESSAAMTLIDEVARLPNDVAALEHYSMTMMLEHGVRDYPLPLPDALTSSLVNLPKNNTMIISVSYLSEDPDAGTYNVETVREIAHSIFSGYTVYVTGSDPLTVDMMGSMEDDLALIEPVAIILILVLIGLVFRSFVASVVPPLVVGLALGITYGLVYLISISVMDVMSMVITLILTSMLGAGCDYCIFILSRYKEERLRGRDVEGAVREAMTWAGESILTSGLTVMIGFGFLFFARLDQMRSFGVLAIGIGIALLVALTFLPALMLTFGDRLFWPTRMIKKEKRSWASSYFSRTARFAIKYGKVLTLMAVLASLPATYVVMTMDTSYDLFEGMPRSEAVMGIEALGEGFGEGRIAPTQIMVRMDQPLYTEPNFDETGLQAIENLTAVIAALENVRTVTSPTSPYGEPWDYTDLSNYPVEEEELYRTVMLSMLGEDEHYVLITVVLVEEPFTVASIHSVDDIRGSLRAWVVDDPQVAEVWVTGSTASMTDISHMTQADMVIIEVLVVVAIYVVLLLVLGSVINPLRSIITILLSISWTLAVTFLVFQEVLGHSISWMVPMVLFVVCLGLGMDYDILLTTRIREEVVKGRSNHEAIVHAVERTGGVITACGIIMAATFGAMMLSETVMLQEFGFALMFAILVDATIVRMYLVPAIMSWLGDWNWWAPAWMRRRLNRGPRSSMNVPPEEAMMMDSKKE